MAYTFEQLRTMTLAELRDIARNMTDESVKGWSQMNKDHLLPAICKAFGLDTHVHHAVVGLDKSQMKARLHALKKQRDEAIEAGEGDKLKAIRRERHSLTHRIRRATV
jgi:L-fucose mutarotase/ribose pyranase (RbsD/FucU family)